MARLGMAAAAALGAWLASAVVAMLPVHETPLGLVLAAPRPWLFAAVAALVAVGLHQRVVWPALAPLLMAALPLMAPWTPAAWVFAGAGLPIIWGGVALGIAWAGRRARHDARRPGQHAAAAVVVGIVWLGGLAVRLGPVALSGDAPHYLTTTQSLLDDGDLDLKNNYDARTYRTFYQGSLEPRHTNTSPWGEDYPFHGLGVSVLIAPGVAAFGVAGATATLVLLMALGGGALWCAAWELTRDAGAAWFGWAALVGAAPYALHAAAIYPDGPAAVAVAAALWLMARLHTKRPAPLWALAVGSIGLAALPWLHVRLALPAGLLGAAVLTAILTRQPDKWTRASWFLMIPIPSAAGWLAAAYVMFGTWNPARAMLQRTAPGGWDAAPAGLLGLLADQEYGLLPAAPVMIAAIVALPWFIRSFPLIGATTGLAAAGVLGMSSLWVWWGGDSAPARFLAVILPALALWLAHLWASRGEPVRRALSVAVAITATMTVLYATVDDGGRAYNHPDGRGSIFEGLSRSVDVAQALPSLHRPGATAASELPLALVWLVGMAAAAAGIIVLPARRGAGTTWALATLVAATGIALSATAGWRVRGVTPWTPGVAANALLQALSQRDVAFVSSGWPPARLPAARLVGRLHVTTPETLALERPSLMYVPNLPAGDYRIHATPRQSDAADATVSLELGREAWPVAEWRLGAPAPSISLLADVHSMRVQGDADADLWLEPVTLRPAEVPAQARRVTRIGDVQMYSMDDNSYVEDRGAWLGGNRASDLLLAAPAAAVVSARFEAGLAAVTLRLAGNWGARDLTLAPRASATVTLGQSAERPIVLRVTVEGGFPARDLGDPSDSRTFGAWVTFDATPPARR